MDDFSWVSIQDYDVDNFTSSGIFLRDENVYFPWEKNLGYNDYKFVLNLYDKNEYFKSGKPNKENFTFYHSCDLKNYIYNTEDFGLEIDYLKIILESSLDRFKYHVERLKRKTNPSTFKIPTYNDEKIEDIQTRFLWFTNESAGSWGGPYDEDGKKGCLVDFGKINPQPFPTINPVENYSYYDIPKNCFNNIYTFYKVSSIEEYLKLKISKKSKREFFYSLSLEHQYQILKNSFRFFSLEESLERTKSYKIYLRGNDDTSYTRYFVNIESLKEEINYLYTMQPLDFNLDILDRGYIFTN